MKYPKLLFAITIILFTNLEHLDSQNLVVNGDIEQDRCSTYWYRGDITGWIRYGTADHVHLDCLRSKGFEYTIPKEGLGALAFYAGGMRNDRDYGEVPVREYVIGSLKETLIAGKDYSVSFWVKAGSVWDNPWENLTTDQLGLTFIQDTSQLDWRWETGEFNWMFELEPALSDFGYIMNYEEYIQIEACYTAEGWEDQFMIGNFTAWEDDELIPFWPTEKPIPTSNILELGYAYFLIDNVEIEAIDDIELEDQSLCNEEVIRITKTDYNFDELLLNDVPVIDSTFLDEEDIYSIEASLGACKKTSSFELDYFECGQCEFYVPNIFSKTENNSNHFLGVGSNCEIIIRDAIIYNRWGNLVYNSSEIQLEGINLNTLNLSSGVYTYLITVRTRTHEKTDEHTIVGTVTLID